MAEIDLLWCIVPLELVGRFMVRNPVAVRQNAVGLHATIGRNKDMVDAALGIQVYVKRVECAIFGKSNSRRFIRIRELSH